MTAISKILFAFCVCLIFGVGAHAQQKATEAVPVSVLKEAGRAGVVVVGSAAKGTWAVTRAAGKYVVLPVVKTAFVEAGPAAGKFLLKSSAKYLLPVVVKLSVL